MENCAFPSNRWGEWPFPTEMIFNNGPVVSRFFQHMKDKFWNFVFYKFIFVFGVVNVQYLNEVGWSLIYIPCRLFKERVFLFMILFFQVILWVSWFTILGFLHLLSQLCKDRFEYVCRVNKEICNGFIIYFLSALIFDYDAGVFSLSACNSSVCNPNHVGSDVGHIHRGRLVRWAQHICIHGSGGEF